MELPRRYPYNPRWRVILACAAFFGACAAFMAYKATHNEVGLIINGIITLPVAVFGFAFFPDLPENTKAFYLKPHERELALSRLPPKNPEGHNIGPSLVKRVLGTLNL